jgi:hypothetical protein
MDIWILMFEVVLTLVLTTTLITAVLGKTQRRWLYVLVLIPWSLGLIGGGWGLVACTVNANHVYFLYPDYLKQSAVMASLLTIAGLSIFITGIRRPEGRLKSGTWPAWRLSMACLGASFLLVVTFYRVDNGICSEMATARERINRQYATLLKPADSVKANAADMYNRAFAQITDTLTAADYTDEQRFYDQQRKWSEAATQPSVANDANRSPEPVTSVTRVLHRSSNRWIRPSARSKPPVFGRFVVFI